MLRDNQTGTRLESATVAPLCASGPMFVSEILETFFFGFQALRRLFGAEPTVRIWWMGRGLEVRRESENLPAS